MRTNEFAQHRRALLTGTELSASLAAVIGDLLRKRGISDSQADPRCQDSCRLSGFSKKSISGAERDWSCRTIHLNAEPHYLRCCFPR